MFDEYKKPNTQTSLLRRLRTIFSIPDRNCLAARDGGNLKASPVKIFKPKNKCSMSTYLSQVLYDKCWRESRPNTGSKRYLRAMLYCTRASQLAKITRYRLINKIQLVDYRGRGTERHNTTQRSDRLQRNMLASWIGLLCVRSGKIPVSSEQDSQLPRWMQKTGKDGSQSSPMASCYAKESGKVTITSLGAVPNLRRPKPYLINERVCNVNRYAYEKGLWSQCPSRSSFDWT